MSIAESSPAAPAPTDGWFHVTPDRFVIGLLVVECLLWLSGQLQWFSKGYAVLTTVAVLGMATLYLLAWFAAAVVCRWLFPFRPHLAAGLVTVVMLFHLLSRLGWFRLSQDNLWAGPIYVAVVGLAMLGLILLHARRVRVRFQFSLRSLFVLTVAVALPFSWLAAERKRVGGRSRQSSGSGGSVTRRHFTIGRSMRRAAFYKGTATRTIKGEGVARRRFLRQHCLREPRRCQGHRRRVGLPYEPG